LGIGDWAQSPIPNPQSPIPNPQSPIPKYYGALIIYIKKIKNIWLYNKYHILEKLNKII
jgi:hypothetical protein